MESHPPIGSEVLSVQGVHKSYKDVHAVAGVSLSIAAGEFVAVLGPNGAGKTTLVEMVEGLHHPDSGLIRLFGMSWRHDERKLRPLLGIALQETRFIDRITVCETLRLFCSFYGQDEQRAEEITRLAGLEEKHESYVMNLSHGQRQKLALGIAIINRPRLLILDEPTTGLDPHSRQELWSILLQLKSQGTTLILTTHYMEEAEYLCDRIYILDHGKVIASGTLDRLLHDQGMEEIIAFAGDGDLDEAELAATPGFRQILWEKQGRQGCIQVRSIVGALPAMLETVKRLGVQLTKLECRRANLNDLFMAMTGRSLHE